MTRTDPAPWLRTYLRDHGDTPSATVKQAGNDAGYSDSALKRARRRAGVQVREVRTATGRTTTWTTTRGGDDPTGPPCPRCGSPFAVGRRITAPPGELHCWTCGWNWTGA